MGPKLGLLGPIDYLLFYLAQSFLSLCKSFLTPHLICMVMMLTSFYSLLFADYCVGNVRVLHQLEPFRQGTDSSLHYAPPTHKLMGDL